MNLACNIATRAEYSCAEVCLFDSTKPAVEVLSWLVCSDQTLKLMINETGLECSDKAS